MMQNNILAMFITLVLALAWLRLMDWIAYRGWISSKTSRKIIHITTGPLFVICWLLFNDKSDGRWLAALVPLSIALQFLLVGLGVIQDEAAVQAMSRSGDRRELLRGPLFYGIVFVILTLIFWKDSPIGLVALMMMCGGDGLADVAGRKSPLIHLPWNEDKTLGGSLAMFFGGFFLSAVILWVFINAGLFVGPFTDYIPGLLFIAAVGTAVESLPLHDVDNLTVSLSTVLTGLFVF